MKHLLIGTLFHLRFIFWKFLPSGFCSLSVLYLDRIFTLKGKSGCLPIEHERESAFVQGGL